MEVTNKSRRTAKKWRWSRGKVSLAVVVVVVTIFAFIWEAHLNRRVHEYEGYLCLVEVQRQLDELYWITPDFLTVNRYSRPGTRIYEVNAIVIHYVANPGTTADQNRRYFESLATRGYRFASSNFIIGLDGEIVQCVPVYEIAFASNHRNADTVSIETCHPDATGQFADETYASMVRLTAWLVHAFGLTADDVIRHYDITGKMCPRYFVVNEAAWYAFRADVADALEQLEYELAHERSRMETQRS